MLYFKKVPGGIPVLATKILATSPSFTELERSKKVKEALAVLGLLEVSKIVTADVIPLTLMVNVSLPSVKKSLTKPIEIVAMPLAFTTAVPLIRPSAKSRELIPLREYGTAVPAATLDVFNVNTTVVPSFSDALLAESE